MRRLIAWSAALALLLLALACRLAGAGSRRHRARLFLATWQRVDQPVATGQVSRTWLWGPAATPPRCWSHTPKSPGGNAPRAVLRQVAHGDHRPGRGDPGSTLVRHQRPAGRRADHRRAAAGRQRRSSSARPAADQRRRRPRRPGRPDLRHLRRAADRAAAARRRAAHAAPGPRRRTSTDDPRWRRRASTAAHRVTVPGIDHQSPRRSGTS